MIYLTTSCNVGRSDTFNIYFLLYIYISTKKGRKIRDERSAGIYFGNFFGLFIVWKVKDLDFEVKI